MNNSNIALEAFNQFSAAFSKKIINPKPCDLFSNIFYYLDYPEGYPRYTYFIIDKKNNILAQCIIVLSPIVKINTMRWQIGWCVKDNYRKKGLASYLVSRSLLDFILDKNKNKNKYIIEAIVDIDNIASLKIGNKIIGGCKYFYKDKSKAYIFQKIISSTNKDMIVT